MSLVDPKRTSCSASKPYAEAHCWDFNAWYQHRICSARRHDNKCGSSFREVMHIVQPVITADLQQR